MMSIAAPTRPIASLLNIETDLVCANHKRRIGDDRARWHGRPPLHCCGSMQGHPQSGLDTDLTVVRVAKGVRVFR